MPRKKTGPGKKSGKGMPPEVAAMMEAAREQGEAFDRAAGIEDLDAAEGQGDGEPGTVPGVGDTFDPAVIAECAEFDHSDTDNARRLKLHFGEDLRVMAQAKAKTPSWAAWTGTHWDMDTGGPRALAIAQKIGGAIALEAHALRMTEKEQRAVDAAKAALAKESSELTPLERSLIGKAEKAADAYRKRVQRRMAHAVTSKNKGRLDSMLGCFAPHCMLPPDAFNADPLKLATLGHTISFVRTVAKAPNPAYSDPDVSAEDVPEFIERPDARVEVVKGHKREDLITRLLPVAYDSKATCPTFLAWLDEFQPSAPVRRLLQVSMGLGILGLTVQRLFFHYGKGANGKSVFMETFCRVVGDLGVTLPSETFVGEGGGKPGAQPDIVRLYGRRLLRVQELPQGEPLREELVKKLTGGEDVPVRDLYQGYFDFKPHATGHMSGNGYPNVQGTDNGIWRRLVVIVWPKTVPTDQQREFEDVLADFAPEYPGILNWLIEGALIFLREGLVVPDECLVATSAMRDEMDKTAGFCRDCVKPSPGGKVQARTLFEAYVNWCVDRAERPISETRFAKIMASKYTREDGRTRQYLDIILHDVPPPKTQPGASGGSYEDHLR